MLRQLGALAMLSTVGCTAFFGTAPPAPEEKTTKESAKKPDEWQWQEDENDEESGVRQLSGLIRRFKAALGRKKFDQAKEFLRRAERGLRLASDVTRSHPDFEDISGTVERSRTRLEDAIEKDRIERRNAAIDSLIRRGEQAVEKGIFVLAELKDRVPTVDDVENVKEVLASVSELERLGVEYMDEQRYADHAKQRTDVAVRLRERQHDAKFQIEATQAVTEPVSNAVEASQQARKAPTADERVAAYGRAVESFAKCAQILTQLTDRPGYAPELALETKLGKLSVDETKRQCLSLSNQARDRVAKLKWRAGMETLVARVDVAVTRARQDLRASDALEAVREAVEVMVQCQSELTKLASDPGALPKATFSTTLGALNATRLIRACAKEQARLSRRQPRLEWLLEVEKLQQGLRDTYQKMTDAVQATDPSQSANMLQEVIGELESCSLQAQRFTASTGADRKLALATPFGKLPIAEISKACRRQLAEAKKERAAAIEAAKLQTFLAKCKGDEVEVARREGIPTHIRAFDGGRIFEYEPPANKRKRNKGVRRFGFDANGKQVDYWLRWRNVVSGLTAELTRAIDAARSAATATARLAAAEAAAPALDRCTSAPQAYAKDPGYDPSIVFETPLGKRTIPALAAACGEERTRLEQSKLPLRWLVRLERLGERADESNAQLLAASSAGDANTRVQMVGTAIGGLTECTERADALAKEVTANPKAKVQTTFGGLSVKELSRACEAARTKAEGAMAEALAHKKLEAFVSTCKGDEIAVARREGEPTRIEKVGQGRVFVYESTNKKGKKSAAKRIAFDANGRRVSEQVLKQ